MLTAFCLLFFGQWPNELGIHPALVFVSLVLDLIMWRRTSGAAGVGVRGER